MSVIAKLPRSRAIVSESWHAYKANAKTFLLYLLPYFLAFILGVIAIGIDRSASIAIGGILWVAASIYSIWMGIVLIRLAYQSVSGTKQVNEQAARLHAWKRVIPMLGISIVTGVLVMLGFFAFVIPMFVLMMMYFAATMSVIIDNEDVHEALYHSVRMTTGRKWNLFWTQLWANVMVGIVYAILAGILAGVSIPLSDFGVLGEMIPSVGVFIAETLVIPWFLLVMVILFRELKKG